VANLQRVGRAAITSLWSEHEPIPEGNEPQWWQLWVRRTDQNWNVFVHFAEVAGITVKGAPLRMPEHIVVVAKARRSQLESSLDLLPRRERSLQLAEDDAERVVGDALAPLERKGWRVFHDFPREVKDAKFNIDHIAVGPTGIFAIETKTPRKLKADDGHVITFDGKTLRGPGGWWNQDWLNQSTKNAAWLEKWLRDRTGERLNVEAVLTFPDWMVPEDSPGPPLVLCSSRLLPCFTNRPTVLSEKQVDQVSRLIEGVCRDVSY
jgi:Nuclease-related domain